MHVWQLAFYALMLGLILIAIGLTITLVMIIRGSFHAEFERDKDTWPD